jgi:hypothetical protein
MRLGRRAIRQEFAIMARVNDSLAGKAQKPSDNSESIDNAGLV